MGVKVRGQQELVKYKSAGRVKCVKQCKCFFKWIVNTVLTAAPSVITSEQEYALQITPGLKYTYLNMSTEKCQPLFLSQKESVQMDVIFYKYNWHNMARNLEGMVLPNIKWKQHMNQSNPQYNHCIVYSLNDSVVVVIAAVKSVSVQS